jgi:hypothetical protein
VVVAYYEDDFIPLCSEPIAEFSDLGSADAIAGLLNAEGVHTKVAPVGSIVELPSSYRVLVDPRQAHRARWILKQDEFSEAELTFLATGELGDDQDPQR